MTPITIVFILAVIIGGVALGLVFVARRMPKNEDDPLQARLAELLNEENRSRSKK
jgi:uncharacterized protein YneF (UPF0154 family)